MKFNLPIFALTMAAGLPGVLAQNARSDGISARLTGQTLVADAAHRLVAQPHLEANLRQQINLFGQELSGPGYYAQFGAGSGKFRLQLKLSIDSKPAIFQQICDGRFLYVEKNLPERKSLMFIDFDRVQETINNADDSRIAAMSPVMLARGGLSRLLRELEQNFQFGEPLPSEIGSGKIPVWTVRGLWKREKLTQLLSGQAAEIEAGKPARLNELAPHLPHSVVLTLGRDETFPLFPYRIVYRKHIIKNVSGRSSLQTQPILILEMFNVRQRADMQSAEFDYKPDDEELVDGTAAYIEKLYKR